MSVPMLHNMSVPSRTVISHAASATPARATIYVLPGSVRDVSPRALLTMLGAPTNGAVEDELRCRIDQHAKTLPWQPVLLATDRETVQADICTDLLTIVTVLSKTGRRVYLRDKEPSLTSIIAGRIVVLQFPDKRSAT